MSGSMVYRLEVADPDIPHMQVFVAAMRSIQERRDNKGFNHIAGHHGAPGWYCWHHQQSQRTPLQARLFLPWHRAYLYDLEQALQDAEGKAALPWWDWTATRQVPPSYRSTQIAGAPNPLRRFRIRVAPTTRRPGINRNTRRRPGAAPGFRLPLKEEIDAVLADSDFASFSDRLQSYHDDVHVWMGGDMSDPTTAAFDPIFFAHHCMIDRLWYLWQVRWGADRIPGDLLPLPLAPFGLDVAGVIDVQTLGYEYAVSSGGTDTSGGGGG